MKWSKGKLLTVLLFLFTLIFLKGSAFGDDSDLSEDLTGLSIEELMDVEVILTSKKPRKLSQAAAAIFVITGEDIRRSGITSISEALRMVPGIQVGRIDSNRWAITSRGFNSRYASKLLVLMDGRTVYSPLFSGAFWEFQDTLLQDIKQIEVIRGPGASLWGANAVNGVINIITRHSEKTHGGLAFAGLGTEERGFGGARYGDKLGEKWNYRIYAKYFNRDEAVNANGEGASDDWQMFRTGFRMDGRLAENTFTLQGDIYSGENSGKGVLPSASPPYAEIYDEQDSPMTGANILGKWQRTFSDDDIISSVPGIPEMSPQKQYISIPYNSVNMMKGEIWGAEFAANWDVSECWRLKTAYTYVQSDMHLKADASLCIAPLTKGGSPAHQFSLRSLMDLPWNLECDLWFRYVDDILDGDVEAYTTLDARLNWNLLKNIEISVVGQNLLEAQHPEFTEMFLFISPAHMERSVYGKITWRF